MTTKRNALKKVVVGKNNTVHYMQADKLYCSGKTATVKEVVKNQKPTCKNCLKKKAVENEKRKATKTGKRPKPEMEVSGIEQTEFPKKRTKIAQLTKTDILRLEEMKKAAKKKAEEMKVKKTNGKGAKYGELKKVVFAEWAKTGTDNYSKRQAKRLHKRLAFDKDGAELVGIEILYRWLYRWKTGKEEFPKVD
jgi:hypothetical protein